MIVKRSATGPIIRPATAADLAEFYASRRKGPLPTVTAWVGVVDGEVICVGGLNHYLGYVEAFLDLTPVAMLYKLEMFRAARQFLAKVPHGKVILATGDPSFARIDRWMVAMGFRPVDGMAGLFERWQV